MAFFGEEEPQTVDVHEQPLRCVICQHDAFYRRQAQMHGRWATMFGIEWTAPICDCLVCGQCGYVHWFFPMKE